MSARKLKVSLTISADVLALVDRDALSRNETRSGVVEQWLRRAASANVEQQIAEATTSYYLSLRGDERADDEAIARGASAAARRVRYDAPTPRTRGTKSKP